MLSMHNNIFISFMVIVFEIFLADKSALSSFDWGKVSGSTELCSLDKPLIRRWLIHIHYIDRSESTDGLVGLVGSEQTTPLLFNMCEYIIIMIIIVNELCVEVVQFHS